MVAIMCALPAEAKGIITFFNLRSVPTTLPFSFYANNDILLLITGVGKARMSSAIGAFFSRYDASMFHAIFNVGICAGGEAYPLGEIVVIHELKDHVRRFYPDMLLAHSFSEGSLQTVDSPCERRLELLELIDMEGSSFFEAASLFISPSRLVVVKVVSDRGDPLFAKNGGKDLYMKHIKPLCEFIAKGFKLELPKETLTCEEKEVLEKIFQERRMSVTQRIAYEKGVISSMVGLGMSFEEAVKGGEGV